LISRLKEFAFVDDVVPVKHGARFVAGQDHGHALRHASPHQVARGGAAAVVEQSMRDACPHTRVAKRVPTRAPGHAIAVEDAIVAHLATLSTSSQHLAERL
jgi:hypothetical protein